uniref:NADH dehydrogenase subunit 3 n=1 Tax=Euwallacea interjectus TaxID=321055 RepID=UPI0022A6A626|nr:NADH dehydrogenase subunit 3 [Euwallacea interjectus]UZT26979.1 NADH dehydrogenase subunit 3 [Euwallacea interjectus]WEP25216.1 NADH dehydrogenase subunit 3 [Euwallacea interjectus]
MITIAVLSSMIILIMLLMIIILNLISKKSFKDREKMSPFECGFDPKNSARLPFSLHFFLIAIIFAIFDVELTLFLPLVLLSKSMNMMNLLTCMSMFIMILLYGLFHEWNQGALNWVK